MLPTGYTTRPPVLADAEAVTALENERSRRDIGVGDTTVERTLMWWGEQDRNLETDNVLVIDGDGCVVATADYSGYPPFTTAEFTFAVATEHEGRDIEEFLLDWTLKRAMQDVPRAPEGERVTLETGVWEQNRADQQRLQRAGFQQSRIWWRMEIDMTEPPPLTTWPPGVSVRIAQPDEVDTVHEAWEDAQADEWGHTRLTDEEFRYYFVEREPNFDPTLWFLAIDDSSGAIVGYVLARWERPGEPQVGQVRYVAVRAPYRRRGIARALLMHAFCEFFRRGKSRVSLAVDSTSLTGADRLYLNVGMRAVQTSLVFVRELRAASDTAASLPDLTD